MSNDTNDMNPDRYEAFNRLTPHSAELSFELQLALSTYLGALEQIGPAVTVEQIQPLHHEMTQHSLRAVFNAFAALEQELVKVRHGITDDDAS